MSITSLRSSVAYALTIPPHVASLRSAVAYALVRPAGVPPAPSFKPSDLRKAQRQLLYDLIEESNPGFQAAFPLDKLDFGTQTAITVDASDVYKRDTSVAVTAKAGSGFIGNKTIKYRRIDFGNLFRGMTAQLNTYSPNTSLTLVEWVNAFNAKFGLLTAGAEFPGIGVLPATNVYNISINSLCYKGAFNIQWLKGKRPMSDMIPDAKKVLVGRTYPGGNDYTTPGRKPVGEFQLYGMDASSIKTQIGTIGTSWNAPVGQSTQAFLDILDWLNNNTGRGNWSNKDSSVEGGICGLTWYTYNIPSASIPEANSARFNKVLVIQSAAGSWFTGKLIIHYNG